MESQTSLTENSENNRRASLLKHSWKRLQNKVCPWSLAPQEPLPCRPKDEESTVYLLIPLILEACSTWGPTSAKIWLATVSFLGHVGKAQPPCASHSKSGDARVCLTHDGHSVGQDQIFWLCAWASAEGEAAPSITLQAQQGGRVLSRIVILVVTVVVIVVSFFSRHAHHRGSWNVGKNQDQESTAKICCTVFQAPSNQSRMFTHGFVSHFLLLPEVRFPWPTSHSLSPEPASTAPHVLLPDLKLGHLTGR